MFEAVVLWLKDIAAVVPLPVFVTVGGIVEEIVAPIPSPLVATLAGSIAVSQGQGVVYLLLLCALATVAKTIGASLFYFLGDKLEHLAVPRFGRYIGVTHSDIETLRSRLSGTWKDQVTLLIIRSIPVMPSTPVSLVCGILKINVRTFFVTTYVGFYIRNMMFFLLGYTGLSAVESLMSGLDTAETVLKIAMVLLAALVLAWLYWKRRTGSPLTWLKR